jgi:hypothetical protein
LLGAPATGSAGFPAGTSLARLNAVPKTWEIAKTLEPELNPSELNIREGRCKIASAARSPDAGIEPASGEAGWKAGAPSWPAGKPALPVAGWKAGAPSGRLESRRSQLAGWKAGAPSGRLESRRSQWPAGKPALPVGRLESRRSQLAGWKAGAPSWPAGKPALPVGGAPSWPAGKPALPVGGAPSGRRRLRRGDDLNPAHLARSAASFDSAQRRRVRREEGAFLPSTSFAPDNRNSPPKSRSKHVGSETSARLYWFD